MNFNYLLIVSLLPIFFNNQLFLPFNSKNRKDISNIQLTKIGEFGLIRKERKTVPSHLHTGIDIKRPNGNYDNELIFPLTKGKVISKRTDGAYAQLIIEHEINNNKFWTLYEHIAGIKVNVHEIVTPETPIARFMNKEELNKYGWQFDHFHFEILKIQPAGFKPDRNNPERFYNSYSLICYTNDDLKKYFYNPLEFMRGNFNQLPKY